MDKDFWGKLLERPVLIILLGAVLLLAGAAAGGKVWSVDLPSMPSASRVAVSVTGLVLIGFSLVLFYKDASDGGGHKRHTSKKYEVKLLDSVDDIYYEACKLIRQCTKNEIIKTTSLGLSPET